MSAFKLFATPWWVNLLALVPVIAFLAFRRRGLALSGSQLLIATLFGVAFGFVEAAAVVYLRAALGYLPGYMGTLADLIRQSSAAAYRQAQTLGNLPRGLLAIEVAREAATIVMLATLALLCAKRARERWAMFLWVFAIWDLSYYAGLWLTTRWPEALTTPDVLFLIPVPWLAQVWLAYLTSGLTIAAVLCSVRRADTRARRRSASATQ
ncbi:MAG: hypothetical protein M0015_05050 [Betaproteobacteria bacterium]|nr:hypothetical protein [Betaproteobacteria bacterium]